MQLDEMICWIFEHNIEELFIGLYEYVPGDFTLDMSESKGVGNAGYKLDGICNECNDDMAVVRGLCRRCYNANRYLGTDTHYPTDDYVKNVKGYVYYVLNYQFDRVMDISLEYGVKITKY